MAGPNAPYSQLDFTQVLRQVFDKTTDRLRVDTGATISLDGEMEVAFSDLSGDSVKVGDGSGHYLAVNNDGSINVATTITGTPDINLQKIAGNTTSVNNGTADVGTLRVAISSNNSPLAVTQSGTWTVALTPESIEIGTVDQGNPTTVGNAWPFKITDGLNTASVSVAGALKTDGSAVTQPVSGSVSVSNFPATQAVTQSTSPWVISGTVTANAGTNLNTSLLALDSTVAKDASLTTINTSINTLLKPANTLAAVTTLGSITSALPTGTNSIGQVTANAGTNLNTSALALDSNLTTLNSKFSVLGQNTMANSTPVVLASNQSTINTTTQDSTTLTNNITGAGQTVTISTVGMGSIAVQITGTFSATLTFQATVDGTNWVSYFGGNTTGVVNPSTTIGGLFTFNASGIQSFRVNCTSYTSGTAIVSIATNQAFSGNTNYIGSIPFQGFAAVPSYILGGSITNTSTATSSNIGVIPVDTVNDSNNSSTANLTAGSTFTGTVRDTGGSLLSPFNYISVYLFADQNCTVQVQQSIDTSIFVNYDVIDTYTTTANTGDGRLFRIVGRGYRVLVTNNGASTTTSFRLQTSSRMFASTLPRALSASGNLKTAISEALPAGTNVIGHVINDASSAVIGHVIVDSGTISTITNPVTISQATASSLNATVVGTGTFAVQAAQSGNWSTRIQDTNGATIALGQTTTANSIPVTLASNQSGLPASVTFTQPNYTDGATSAISLDINGNLRTVEINSDNIIDLLQQLIIETRAMRAAVVALAIDGNKYLDKDFDPNFTDFSNNSN